MLVQADNLAVRETEALPDAVAQHEAAVEHRHDRLVARHQGAIDIDQNLVVARIRDIALGARTGGGGGWGHGLVAPMLRPMARWTTSSPPPAWGPVAGRAIPSPGESSSVTIPPATRRIAAGKRD